MVNKNLLMGYIKSSGHTLESLAEEVGMNPATLYRKINGITDFKRAEMLNLRRVLHLDAESADAVFFADELT